MTELGLILLLIGWIIQLYKVWQGNKTIDVWFLGFYGVGCAMLAWSGITTGAPIIGWLNFVILVPIGLIIWKKK